MKKLQNELLYELAAWVQQLPAFGLEVPVQNLGNFGVYLAACAKKRKERIGIQNSPYSFLYY